VKPLKTAATIRAEAASDGGLLLHPITQMRFFYAASGRDASRRASPRIVWTIFTVLVLLLGWLIHSATRHPGSMSGWVPANARTEQKPAR
jgi:hypothetical protein